MLAAPRIVSAKMFPTMAVRFGVLLKKNRNQLSPWSPLELISILVVHLNQRRTFVDCFSMEQSHF
jgi:hypothetical protein